MGGLSTVWGSGVLPFCDADTLDWPVSTSDLAPHYRAVLEFMPISGARDALEAEFPLFSDRVADLRPSRQAEAFFRDVGRRRAMLERAGITAGRAGWLSTPPPTRCWVGRPGALWPLPLWLPLPPHLQQ